MSKITKISKIKEYVAPVQYSNNDISTWQLQPTNFSVNPQESTPEAVFFKPDGTKMYILGRSGDDVGEYALSTAWDISTASYTDALTGLGSSPASEPNPYGMYISPDGIYLYIVGHSTDQVVQYTMSTAWDVSTASYTREQALTDSGGSYSNPNGIHFKPDGTMFWVCSSSEDTIQQYTLSTAWDVSTLSTGYSFSLINFFILNDLSGATPNGDIGSSEDLFFSEDGTKVWFVENGYDSVHQLKLSTAWDMSTATYDAKGIRVSMYESAVEGIYVNETAGKAFTVSSSTDIVRSFNLGGTVFSNTNNASIGFDSGIGVKGNASFSGTSSFVDITAQAGYFYGSFATYSTTNIVHGNGGTANINDGTTYTGDALLDVMTNVYYGANSSDLSVQDTYIHNMNFGRPRGGAKVTLNIGRRVGNNGSIVNHTGIMDVVSMAQTFDHYGSLDVGRTLQVDGKADLEVFDLGGTVVFNDTFTETNTTAIESHTPDLGAGWTKVFDTGSTTTLNIIGGGGYGQLSNSESSDGVMFLADTTPTGVDYEVRVDFKRRDNGDDVFLIVIKYQDANNYYALQWSASYSTYCRLFKVEGGSLVNVESNFNYGAMNSTADNLSTALKLRFIDNTLMVWDIDSNDYKSFRGSYPVTTDFNDGNGGTYHKVGMAFGDLFGGGLDSTTTWKIDKFEVKMLSSAATFAAATKSYIDAGNFGVGITNPTSKFHVIGDARIQGNLTVNGTYTQIDTDVTTTEQWLVTNDGTGPAAVINQKGSQDIFDVQDDGTSVLYVKDGGNIGIGTTSPGQKLTVNEGYISVTGAGTSHGYMLSRDGLDTYRIRHLDGGLTIQNSTDSRKEMTFDGDGNIGIGTTSPSAVLHAYATTGIISESPGNASIVIRRDDNTAYGSLLKYHSGNSEKWVAGLSDSGDFTNSTGNEYFIGTGKTTPLFLINTSGNVGIGTTSPGNKLEVNSGTTNVAGVFKSSDNQAWISVQDDDSGTYGALFGTDSDANHDIVLADRSANKRLVISTTTGNVGIGTASPTEKLHVSGNALASNLISSGYVKLGADNQILSDGSITIDIDYNNNQTDRVFSVRKDNTTELFRVQENGNVGIGTASPYGKLHVLDSATGAVGMTVHNNLEATGNSAALWFKVAGSTADYRKGAVLFVNDGTGYGRGDFYFASNTSTSSTSIASTSDAKMVIKGATGKVGIGTTSPSQKLEVVGNINLNTVGNELQFSNHNVGAYRDANNRLVLAGYGGIDFVAENVAGMENQANRVRITSAGNVGIGTTSPASLLHVAGTVQVGVDDTGHDVIFYGATSGRYLQWDESSDRLEFRDSVSAVFGNGADLHIQHDGTDSSISNNTGDLKIIQNADDKDIIFQSDDGSGGVETYFFLDGSNNQTTFQNNLKLEDNHALRLGNGNDFTATHDGTDTFLGNNTGDLYITQQADDKDIFIRGDDGSGGVTEYIRIDGGVKRTLFKEEGRFTDSVNLKFGTGGDTMIYHDGSNSYIDHTGTGNLNIRQGTDDGDISFQCDDGSGGLAEYFRLDGSVGMTVFPDAKKLSFGNSFDLKLEHDGSNSYLSHEGTGNLIVRNTTDDGDIIFQSDDGSGGVETYFLLDGSASSGNPVTIFPDNSKLAIGTSSHGISLVHDGSNSTITNAIGNLTITNFQDDGDIIFKSDDGSGSTTEYFRLDGGDERVLFSKEVRLNDSVSLKLGSFGDLQMYHDGSNSYMRQISSGNLYIDQLVDDSDIVLRSDDGSGGLATYLTIDGSTKTVDVDVPIEINNQMLLGSKQAYTLPAQGTRMRLLQIADNTLCRVYLETSENSYHQPIVLDIFYRAQYTTSKPQIVRSESYEWHAHSNDVIFTSDQAGTAGADSYIYAEKVAYSTGRPLNIRKIEVFDGTLTVLDGSTTDTNGGTDETIVSTFAELNLGDNDLIKLGDGGDLSFIHNGTNSFIQNSTGDLSISNYANDKDILFQSDDGSGGVETYFYLDGSANTSGSPKTIFPDNSHLALGNSGDFFMYHDGTDTILDNLTGNITIQNKSDDKDIIFKSDDGSGGVAEYFRVDGGAEVTLFSKPIRIHNVDQTANPRLSLGRQLAESINFDVEDRTARIYYKQDETSGYHDLKITLDSDTSDTKDIKLGFRDADGSNESIKFTLDENGSVGIGTTTPSARLEVSSDSSYSSDLNILSISGTKTGGTAVTNVKGINVDIGSNDHVTGHDITNLYGAYINNNASGSSATVINNWYGVYVPAVDADRVSNSVSAYFGDNVGIGTASPGFKFVVNSSTADTVAKFESTDAIARLELKDDDDSAYVGTQDNKAFIGMEANATGTNNLIVTSAGNVGIGTSSPSEKLEVSGNIKLSGNLDIGGSVQKQIQVFPMNFTDDLGTDKHFMPFVTNTEQTVNYQEEACMVMPADGRVVSVTVHYSQMHGADGNITVGIETSPCGQSYTNTWTVEETEVIAATVDDDHHVFHFAFDNAKHFESTEKMAISIQQSADMQSASRFFWVTAVVEYDWSTFLGGTSAEYTTTP